MTDKRIIVDGVDVSGCEYCLKMTKYRCTIQRDVYKCLCEENPNCYYKQLKRKEQECNKLYIQIEADEEYYKEKEDTLRKIIKNKEERNIELYKENNKLKQALIEIEKIAEPFCNACQEFEPEKRGKNCMYCNCGKILQKINGKQNER